jgi:hypothetical protein
LWNISYRGKFMPLINYICLLKAIRWDLLDIMCSEQFVMQSSNCSTKSSSFLSAQINNLRLLQTSSHHLITLICDCYSVAWIVFRRSPGISSFSTLYIRLSYTYQYSTGRFFFLVKITSPGNWYQTIFWIHLPPYY